MRVRLAACPHVGKQALHHSETQLIPVQVAIDQQRAAAMLRNDTHTASTRDGRSTLADLLPMRVRFFEARCAAAPSVDARSAAAPAADADAGGCSPDDSVDDTRVLFGQR